MVLPDKTVISRQHAARVCQPETRAGSVRNTRASVVIFLPYLGPGGRSHKANSSLLGVPRSMCWGQTKKDLPLELILVVRRGRRLGAAVTGNA